MSAHGIRTRCVICLTPHEVRAVNLSFGIRVQLCELHSSRRYLTEDCGRRFVGRLTELWQSHGILNTTRIRALAAHIRRVRNAMKADTLPGSHAWLPEREECERRFAAGETVLEVIDDIRSPVRWNGRKPPSVRTIRRWYADGRWLAPPTPKHPVLRAIGDVALDALIIAYEIGTTYAWEDWIVRHGADMSPGWQRIEQRRRRRPHAGSG